MHEKTEEKAPLFRFIDQLKNLAKQIPSETKGAPLLKRVGTAFIGPVEANRLYGKQDGYYEMNTGRLKQYFDRNAIIHGYAVFLFSMLLGISGISAAVPAAVGFSGLLGFVGLERLISGLDKAQHGLNGRYKNRLNNVLTGSGIAAPLDQSKNVGDAVRRRPWWRRKRK